MKYCKACDTTKSKSEFGKCKPDLVKKNNLDGLQYTCKECRKTRCKKSYEKVGRETHQKHYVENLDKLKTNSIKRHHLLKKDTNYIVKRKAVGNKRRAMKINAEGSFTVEEILILFDVQSGSCVYCGTELNRTGSSHYHIDHIKPLSRGGTNYVDNLQLLCPHCNLSKSKKTHEEFLIYRQLIARKRGKS